jgi:hypothetical protein
MGTAGSKKEGADPAAEFERACKVGDVVAVAEVLEAARASAAGSATTLSRLLPEWLTRDHAGRCLLRATSGETSLELVKLLAACKPNIDAQNVYGNTPAHNCVLSHARRSVKKERLRVLDYLLAYGARTDIENRDRLTALALACVQGTALWYSGVMARAAHYRVAVSSQRTSRQPHRSRRGGQACGSSMNGSRGHQKMPHVGWQAAFCVITPSLAMNSGHGCSSASWRCSGSHRRGDSTSRKWSDSSGLLGK